MIVELLRGIEQLPEEMAGLAVMAGQKSGHSFKPKRLVKKSPVQSPSVAVRQQNGIETHSTP